MVRKGNVVDDLRRIQRRIRRIPIDLRDPQQIESMKFAVAAVNDVIGHLQDIQEFHLEDLQEVQHGV